VDQRENFLKIEKEKLSKQIHKRIKQLAGFDLGQKCCEIQAWQNAQRKNLILLSPA
jgi:hypothetical protein